MSESDGPSMNSAPTSVEALIEVAVERAVHRILGPYLHRLTACEPAVYTIVQAAQVLQVSDDTISRLVRRGILPRGPHVDGKVLIPRRAIDLLIDNNAQALPATDAGESPESNRSMRSAAS